MSMTHTGSKVQITCEKKSVMAGGISEIVESKKKFIFTVIFLNLDSKQKSGQRSQGTGNEFETKEKPDIDNKVQSTNEDSQSKNDAYLPSELLHFTFDARNFKVKKDVPIYCRECSEDGHIPRNCPLVNVKLEVLPPMTKEFRSILDKVCNSVMAELELKPEEFDIRINILKKTEQYLRERYRSK